MFSGFSRVLEKGRLGRWESCAISFERGKTASLDEENGFLSGWRAQICYALNERIVGKE